MRMNIKKRNQEIRKRENEFYKTVINPWLYKKRVEQFPSPYYELKYNLSWYYGLKSIENDKNLEPIPGTRFYEANTIFKLLVDYCFDHNLYDDNGDPIVCITCKKDIMKYIYDHSKHE